MSMIPCNGLSQELRQQAKLWTEILQHTSQRRLLPLMSHWELSDEECVESSDDECVPCSYE